MKKVYLTAAVVAAMSATFVACTNEFEAPVSPDTAVAEGQTGRVVFNVNTGKDVSFTRTGDVAEDQKLKTLSVFVFDRSGDRVPGIKQTYADTDIADGKLAVTIPADQMNKVGFKAYLAANINPTADMSTEAILLNQMSGRTKADIPAWGIPMGAAPISLNTTSATITAEAVMKRAMSSLFVKVNATSGSNSTTINAGDFTYKVKNVRTDKGFVFRDSVCTGEVIPEATWTPKANSNEEELLGYMFQSNGFEVEVTPNADKPELGTASRTVVVAADKAKKRNKKYVLNVLPTVSTTGKLDFTIKIEEWDMENGSFDVDWGERFGLSLPSKVKEVDGELVLENAIAGQAVNYSKPGEWFTLAEGVVLAGVAISDLTDSNGKGLSMVGDQLKGDCQNLSSVTGKMTVTTMKGSVIAKQDFPVRLEGYYYGGKDVGDYHNNNFRSVRLASINAVEVGVERTGGPDERIIEAVLDLDTGWKIVGVSLNPNGPFINEINLTNRLSIRREFNTITEVVSVSAGIMNAWSEYYVQISKGSRTAVRKFKIRRIK